jgi:hypothetical protein
LIPLEVAVSTRQRELGRNGALFREINNYIADVSRKLAGAEDFEVLCECEQLSCVETIALTMDDYRAARENEAAFIVAPGHRAVEGARIVRATESYLLVEKTPA